MHHANLIEEQIESCCKLLLIFREERESFGEQETVDLSLVMKMLKRKKDILASFETQKNLMASIRETGYQDEVLEKKLLKELGKILEQLLVIDQENEVLLRNILTKKPGKSEVKRNSIKSPMRPSLPFCPENKKAKEQVTDAVPSISEPLPAPAMTSDFQKNTAAMNKLNHFSRSRLKAYGA
jgi:hypothetical protein